MSQQLLKIIIKQTLLTEAPIDVWKAKNQSLPSKQIKQAEAYFIDLTGKYSASLHPTAKDLASLSFEQLETLYKTVETSKSKNLKSQYIQWITGQLKQIPDLNLQQIIEDYIPPLLSLQKNKEKFESNFLENLQSIEELNKALNQKASSGGLAAPVPEAHLGKIAEENGWILYMPHTTEASCEIGKTGGRRDTTWCTTRPDSSNMFLQYSASQNSNIILFYVIKKGVNAETDPFAKMSVGFIDGEPKFSQGAGGVSVNASNDNLDQKKFEQVLGEDRANKFLQIMQEKAGSLKGEHPAKEEFRKLIQNPKAFQAKIGGYAKDENGRELRKNFIEAALGYKEVSPEILTTLARDPDRDVRQEVAKNRKTPPETLTFLAGDKDSFVRNLVADNENIPPKALTFLARDPDRDVRQAVARNLNTPREALIALARDENYDVRINVAGNPNTPPEALAALAALSKSKETTILYTIAKNPNTPTKILADLAKSKDKNVVYAVAQNPNTPTKILADFAALTGDVNLAIRRYTARNPNLPTEIFTTLAGDRDKYIRGNVAQNPNTPTKILAFLAGDPDRDVRTAVARNLNTPREALAALAGDTDENVKRRAKATLEALKAKPLVEAIIMEKVWRKLLRAI